MKLFSLLGAALLVIIDSSSVVSALDIVPEAKKFHEVNEIETNTNDVANNVTKPYETFALFFYQSFFDRITQVIAPPLMENIYHFPL